MALVLVATSSGVRTFTSAGEGAVEMSGHPIHSLARAGGSSCVAIVAAHQVWRRAATAEWSHVATTNAMLSSIVSVNGQILCGSMADAALYRVTADNELERLTGFDTAPGRAGWIAQGPPLHVRSLAGTADAILAAVHVGGIPRSTDGGRTWAPTIPIDHDVHEIQSHASTPLVAAATGIGLAVSLDAGQTWRVFSEGPEVKDSLAVAVLEDQVLFSVQDGPFAARSQIWRWSIGGSHLDHVQEGLPTWLSGKVDTAHLAAGGGRAAVVDGGGALWLSREGSSGWERIASDLHGAFAVLIPGS